MTRFHQRLGMVVVSTVFFLFHGCGGTSKSAVVHDDTDRVGRKATVVKFEIDFKTRTIIARIENSDRAAARLSTYELGTALLALTLVGPDGEEYALMTDRRSSGPYIRPGLLSRSVGIPVGQYVDFQCSVPNDYVLSRKGSGPAQAEPLDKVPEQLRWHLGAIVDGPFDEEHPKVKYDSWQLMGRGVARVALQDSVITGDRPD